MILGIYVFLGLGLYLILKDKELQENQKKEKCISCGREVDYNSLNCPCCHEELKRVCDNCGRYIDNSWRNCPFCEENSNK